MLRSLYEVTGASYVKTVDLTADADMKQRLFFAILLIVVLALILKYGANAASLPAALSI